MNISPEVLEESEKFKQETLKSIKQPTKDPIDDAGLEWAVIRLVEENLGSMIEIELEWSYEDVNKMLKYLDWKQEREAKAQKKQMFESMVGG